MVDLINKYLEQIEKMSNIDIDTLLNKSLSLYYDDNLIDMYHHKKKSLCIALFFKDIDFVLSLKLGKKTCSIFDCYSKKKDIDIDELISKYFYNNKIPNFIDEILYLYRKNDDINIDEIKKNNRIEDLSLLKKYINNVDYSDRLINMTIEDKINLIKKIFLDIKII